MVVLFGEAKGNVICPLCQDTEKKEKVMIWADSFTGYAHASCMEIAINTIGIYSKWVVYFVNHITDIQQVKS